MSYSRVEKREVEVHFNREIFPLPEASALVWREGESLVYQGKTLKEVQWGPWNQCPIDKLEAVEAGASDESCKIGAYFPLQDRTEGPYKTYLTTRSTYHSPSKYSKWYWRLPIGLDLSLDLQQIEAQGIGSFEFDMSWFSGLRVRDFFRENEDLYRGHSETSWNPSSDTLNECWSYLIKDTSWPISVRSLMGAALALGNLSYDTAKKVKFIEGKDDWWHSPEVYVP